MTFLVADFSTGAAMDAFRYDAPYLFIGASFVTVGLLAAGFAAIQRKRDPLPLYFALFACLYGTRLWVQSDLAKILLQNSTIYWRVVAAIDYLMPIPALLFFNATGLIRKWTAIAAYIFASIGLLLTTAVLIFGPAAKYDSINRIAATVAVLTLIVELSRGRWAAAEDDLLMFRRGIFAFGAFALFDNLSGEFSLSLPRLEPIGFSIFLGTMGYAAARRSLHRDHQLDELQKELEVARRIQLSILPGEFPSSPNFTVSARYVPMTSVAGDFYDYVISENGKAGLLIADVSGHGVPAALIASMVKLAAASQRQHAAHPATFISGMNAALCGNTQSQFVTAAYLYLDAEARELRYSAAAHPPMLVARSGHVIEIEENGLMLAAFDFANYTEVKHPLKNGDRLLLYTDGIIEAADSTGEFFGNARLSSLVRQTLTISAAQAADQIIATVRQWTPRQEDDLTVIVCDYLDCAGT